LRVGTLDVAILVDGEGSFATVAEAFPSLSSGEEWRLPISAVLIRGNGTTVLVDTGRALQRRATLPSNREPCRSGSD
jgi:hypothetical protein